MNGLRKKAERWCARAQCSPSLVVIPLLIVLGVVVFSHRAAMVRPAIVTASILSTVLLLVGLVAMSRAAHRRHRAQAVGSTPAAVAAPVAPAVAATVPMPRVSQPDSIAADIEVLAGDSEISVTEDGKIIHKSGVA